MPSSYDLGEQIRRIAEKEAEKVARQSAPRGSPLEPIQVGSDESIRRGLEELTKRVEALDERVKRLESKIT